MKITNNHLLVERLKHQNTKFKSMVIQILFKNLEAGNEEKRFYSWDVLRCLYCKGE